MGLFSKKEPYQYKVLERYKIDIEKTNQLFQSGQTNTESWKGREFCELVAEDSQYRFYGYRTHSDHSGGYILRQEKQNPKKVVFFGDNKQMNCVFHGYLFQVNRSGELGRFGITGRNVNDGSLTQFNWLSDKAKYIVINGYGRFYSQDSVKSVSVNNDKMIFKVSREKSSDPRKKEASTDKYDIDVEYDLVVEFISGKFKATRMFPAITPTDTPDDTTHSGNEGTQKREDDISSNKNSQSETQGVLGRDESKHISCEYEGHEDDCPNDCRKCAISVKTDGDIALAQNQLDDAIKQYKKAVFAEPKFAEAWVNLGNAYGMKSEYNNALSAFDKAIAIDPIYGKALFGKAITLRNMGQLEEAMKIANILIELYNAPEVVSFKQGLLEHGVADNQYIIENKKLAVALDNYALHLMEENNLLDEDGKITIINGLYQPDSFITQTLAYCKKKYASLGKTKVRGECIITSFYGSICATLLYSKDNTIFDSASSFEYLNSHIDVEFTDVNAERLLNTKAGEEKAENIWEIISPYVSFSQEAFCRSPLLTDELILAAMKRAYEIGMLTALFYLSGKDKKHVLATRGEIDAALSKLSASSKDYENPPPESAMCYSIRTPEEVSISFRCDKCGKTQTIKVYAGHENLISKYRKMAEEFVALGYNAEVFAVCDECANSHFPSTSTWRTNNIVFSFMAKNSTTPQYSYPSSWRYDDFEYRVALCFLNGATTVDELAAETGTRLNSDVYIKHVQSVIGKMRR